MSEVIVANLKALIECKDFDEVRFFDITFINSKFAWVRRTGVDLKLDNWNEFIEKFGDDYYDSLEDYRYGAAKYKKFSNWIKENNLDTTLNTTEGR